MPAARFFMIKLKKQAAGGYYQDCTEEKQERTSENAWYEKIQKLTLKIQNLIIENRTI